MPPLLRVSAAIAVLVLVLLVTPRLSKRSHVQILARLAQPLTPHAGGEHRKKRTVIRTPLNSDLELVDFWSRIVRDWLVPFRAGITRADIDDTFVLTRGKVVLFQHIQGEFYVVDPKKWCSNPPAIDIFQKTRCAAIYSILQETWTQMHGTLPDFEFVYDFEDLPAWKTDKATINRTSMPGFGCVRCWQKDFMSFPMFGSHKRWDLSKLDGKIAEIVNRRPRPFVDRRSAAVFRGGMRGCSFPSDHSDMQRWLWHEFGNFYTDKGVPCGRARLQQVARDHPELVDFVNTDIPGSPRMPMNQQEDTFKYIISAEGHGGWADRLFELMFYDMGVFVQDHPCKEWYEELFAPFKHYIPVANDFSDLVGRIMWAERHPHAVEQMIRSRIAWARRVLSKDGVVVFSTVLWTQYAEMLRYPITRRNDTVPLKLIFPINWA